VVTSLTGESVLAQVLRVLEVEGTAIRDAAKRLDAGELGRAVDLLLHCRGKLLVLGTGKSGIAARKVASTLTSTGAAAIYLHPLDALHGDIGVVMADDVAIAVSNSGEGEELVAVLTYLRRRDVPIVAIVGDMGSSVARRSDAALDASVDQEACPLNLAPTASTTVAVVLGDALAAVLMTAKGFTAEDFALNHPAGTLGKRLTLRVADLMHTGPANPAVAPQATLMDVLETITRGGLGAANVVDDAMRLVGIVTDGDVRRTVQNRGLADLEDLRVPEIMTARPIVVSPGTLAYDALRLMEDRPSQIAVLPVVGDDERCVGLLRLHDLVQAGLR
jgi:arabinose-5-phosphate isomerase